MVPERLDVSQTSQAERMKWLSLVLVRWGNSVSGKRLTVLITLNHLAGKTMVHPDRNGWDHILTRTIWLYIPSNSHRMTLKMGLGFLFQM